MGAFENEIRENETFESLMDLYSKSIDKNRTLTAGRACRKKRRDE